MVLGPCLARDETQSISKYLGSGSLVKHLSTHLDKCSMISWKQGFSSYCLSFPFLTITKTVLDIKYFRRLKLLLFLLFLGGPPKWFWRTCSPPLTMLSPSDRVVQCEGGRMWWCQQPPGLFCNVGGLASLKGYTQRGLAGHRLPCMPSLYHLFVP